MTSPENPNIRERVRQKLTAMAARYPGADAIQFPAQGQFSRALALDMGTRMCANNDLVRFCLLNYLILSLKKQITDFGPICVIDSNNKM